MRESFYCHQSNINQFVHQCLIIAGTICHKSVESSSFFLSLQAKDDEDRPAITSFLHHPTIPITSISHGMYTVHITAVWWRHLINNITK